MRLVITYASENDYRLSIDVEAMVTLRYLRLWPKDPMGASFDRIEEPVHQGIPEFEVRDIVTLLGDGNETTNVS